MKVKTANIKSILCCPTKEKEIDITFISHNHLDYVGGMKWMQANTFSPNNTSTWRM